MDSPWQPRRVALWGGVLGGGTSRARARARARALGRGARRLVRLHESRTAGARLRGDGAGAGTGTGTGSWRVACASEVVGGARGDGGLVSDALSYTMAVKRQRQRQLRTCNAPPLNAHQAPRLVSAGGGLALPPSRLMLRPCRASIGSGTIQ